MEAGTKRRRGNFRQFEAVENILKARFILTFLISYVPLSEVIYLAEYTRVEAGYDWIAVKRTAMVIIDLNSLVRDK